MVFSLTGVGNDALAARSYRTLGASPVRIEILRLLLAAGELSAADLMAELGLTRNGVRRHLHALRQDGLLTERHTTHPRGSGPITYWGADPDEVIDVLVSCA
jgi:predicted ArsR family transcriptional regulator